MFKVLFFIVATLLISSDLLSQGIKIGETGTPAHQDAILELESNSKGLLLPRLTTVERNSMTAPPPGMQIYNIDTDCIELFFVNGGWKPVDCGCISFPDASFANPTGFANVPLSLSANTVLITNTYNWTFDQGNPASSTNTSENVTWTTAGTYEVTLQVTDINNCSASTTENIEIIPCASFPDATFTGSNGSINSPISFNANGSGSGYTYAWSFPSGTPSTSSLQNPSVEWTAAGTYTVELTVTDNLGCSSTETMVITITLCTPDGPWNFTNCNAVGRVGPTQAQCNSGYNSTNLNGQVTLSGGIQQWTVPSTGTYRIEAAGAQGGGQNPSGSRPGGRGSIVRGDFQLTQGEVIRILVGHVGGGGNSSSWGHGGGGGSFVVRAPYNTNGSILVIAGGGGGASPSRSSPGVNATTSNNGTANQGGQLAGGTNGNGGSANRNGGGGGGFFTNGQNSNPLRGYGGQSFINGGAGGISNSSSANADYRVGGFGGGGGGTSSTPDGGGGGGGYSGGAGGHHPSSSTNMGGGGGGSFNSGTNQINTPGANTGHGYVTIEKICP